MELMISYALGKIRRLFEGIGRFSLFFLTVLKHLFTRPIRKRLVYEQMVYLGINSLAITIVTAVFVGMAFTIQVVREFLKFGAGEMVGGIVGMAVWRELGPMMTGAVIAGRIGAAISAELGSMKVTEQVEALEAMSQDPVEYLALPRVLALTLMMPLLVGIADIFGYFSGLLIAISTGRINPNAYFYSTQTMLGLSDITGGLVKGLFFGMAIALIGAYFGLKAESGAKGVGKVTRHAVVVSLITIFVLNYFLSLVL